MSKESKRFPKRAQNRGVEVRELGKGGPESQRKEIPAVGRVGGGVSERRGPDSGRVICNRSGRRRGRSGRAAKMDLNVVLGAGVLVVAIIGGALLISRLGNRSGAAKGKGPSVVRDETQEVQVSQFLLSLAPDKIAAETEKGVRRFMESATGAERLRWSRPVDGLEQRMTEYYGREEVDPPTGFGKIVSSRGVAFGGVPMQVVIVREKGSERTFPFTMLPGSDRMLVEWDSSTAYGEMDWGRFLKDRPETPTQMRVFMLRSDYYNYEFADDRVYACYQIRSRESGSTLYGYVDRESEVAKKLINAVAENTAIPVNILIRFLPDMAGKNMVLIEDLVHPFWVDVASLKAQEKE